MSLKPTKCGSAYRHGLAVAIAALLLSVGAGLSMAQGLIFAKSGLAVQTAQNGRHDFQVELAVTPSQRAQGLMFRESLPPNAGMLFIYEQERPVAMWMKNTLVSLDMFFISPEGRIVRIAERTTPHSLETIDSRYPVKGVLELAAGTAARLGIAPGDRVLHPAFGSRP